MLLVIFIGLCCLTSAYFVGDAVTRSPASVAPPCDARPSRRLAGARAGVAAPFRGAWSSRWAALARGTLKLHPKTTVEGVSTRLLAAGLGRTISPTAFLAFKSGLAIAGVFLGILFGGALASAGGVLFCSVAFAGTGFIAPDFFVSSKARSRKESIRAELPDALDLMAVSVEAGMGFDGAISKLTEHMDGPLADEFALTLSEIRIGEGRSDALKKLASRTDTPELNCLCARSSRPTSSASARPDPARRRPDSRLSARPRLRAR
jgi:Flp pilus assembly protein TadB